VSKAPFDLVVTGIGVVTPLGDEVESLWRALLGGEVGLRRLRRFDVSRLSADKGGEVQGLDASPGGGGEARSLAFTRKAIATAVDDAGLETSGIPPERIGVCVGSVMATRPAIEAWLSTRGEWDSTFPRGGAWTSPASLSRVPAQDHGFNGPNSVISSACASGNSAIAVGANAIRKGRADAMVVAGADELSEAMLLMFESFRSLTPDTVRPFDRNRLGLLLGEGAAALVIEREDAAKREVRAYGRVMGYSNVADAHHITAPDPEGAGAKRAMLAALRRADIGSEDVSHVSSHGTGTASNDVSEARAIHDVFGSRCDELPISATKSMLGHMQGAASSIEAVVCLLGIRDDLVPPVANHETPDPACNLDVVSGRARKGRVDFALSNSFGFGGNIECVVFGPA
jgi:3-oxoacyl-(acyl-carrier-protein) synthase